MKIVKKLYKKVLFIIVACYVVSIFITQQKTLISYQKEIKEELIAMKENADSPEYIEKIAREKLGMYLPNERVYIDIEK